MLDKKFKVSRKKGQSFLWVTFGIFVFTLLICSQTIHSFNENIIKYVITVAVIAIVGGIIACILTKESYLKITDNGFEITTGKKITSYSFSDYLGSNVVRHYYNGIYTGVTREIKIRDNTLKGNDKTKTINCNNLKKEKYAELVSFLSKSEFVENHSDAVPDNFFDSEKFFNVPNESIIKAKKAHMITSCVLGAIALIGLVIVWWIVLMKTSTIGFTILSIGTLIGVCIFVVPVIMDYIKIVTIPDHVTCDNQTLAIGKDSFTVDSIANIRMVPASYNILSRDLIVIGTDGIKHKYNFGKAKDKATRTYSEYESLYTTIKIWCIQKGVNFMSILG